MHFTAVADINKTCTILIACNVNQLVLYNSISYMHCVYQLSPNMYSLDDILIACLMNQSLLWAKTCNKQQENER